METTIFTAFGRQFRLTQHFVDYAYNIAIAVVSPAHVPDCAWSVASSDIDDPGTLYMYAHVLRGGGVRAPTAANAADFARMIYNIAFEGQETAPSSLREPEGSVLDENTVAH